MINPSIPNRTDNDNPHSTGYSAHQWEAGAVYALMILLAPIALAIGLTIGASFCLCFVLLVAWIVGMCQFPFTLFNFTTTDHTIVSIACILSTLTTLFFIGTLALEYYIERRKENGQLG